MSTMITTVGTLFTAFLGWIGEFVTSLFVTPGTSDTYADLTILGAGLLLGLVCAVILFAVKVVRKVFWGA